MKRRRNTRKVHHEKQETFFTKLANGIITICLTAGMLWGLQTYSASTSLKFAQVSDVHFLENGSNTTFKMIGESPRLLDDAVTQLNEHNDLDFVMFTGDLIDKPFEKENEIKEKTKRLQEINIELGIDENEKQVMDEPENDELEKENKEKNLER